MHCSSFALFAWYPFGSLRPSPILFFRFTAMPWIGGGYWYIAIDTLSTRLTWLLLIPLWSPWVVRDPRSSTDELLSELFYENCVRMIRQWNDVVVWQSFDDDSCRQFDDRKDMAEKAVAGGRVCKYAPRAQFSACTDGFIPDNGQHIWVHTQLVLSTQKILPANIT